MAGKPHIPESVLVRIWEEQRFNPDSLKTTTGVPLQVVKRGWRNYDNGPDFKAALIRIGDQMYDGDVELHLEVADWWAHGHETDPHYNRTILHVVLWESENPGSSAIGNLEPRKANGEVVPTVVVQDCLTESLQTLLAIFRRSDRRRQQKLLACQKHTGALPLVQILDRLRRLGRERLYERARRFERRLKSDRILHPPPPSFDNPSTSLRTGLRTGFSKGEFQQLLYEAICEGLGYSSNKRPFVELASRLPLDQIYAHLPKNNRDSSPTDLLWIQAMLFGVSGLLPQPGGQTKVCPPDLETRAYVTELRSLWEMLLPCLDVVPMKPEEWHFFRLRPINFPTRRLAALSYLLLSYMVQPVFENYLWLFTLFSEHPEYRSQHIRLLERTLEIPVVDYWKGRYFFGKAVFREHDRMFLGHSRIRDIIISAVFPVFLLYALHTPQADLESQILSLYQIFPSPSWNRVTRMIFEQLFAHRKEPLPQIQTAMIYQGMIQLSKQYCSLPACKFCPFGGNEKDL
jgi:hypothetical protein